MRVKTVFTTQKDNNYPHICKKHPTFATENEYKQQNKKVMRHSNSISNEAKSYTDNVKVALQNGCQWIQLSMGNSTDEEFVELASSIKNLCDEYHAYLIIEDHVRLAKQVKANGVHLNHKSCIAAARKELGALMRLIMTRNVVSKLRVLTAPTSITWAIRCLRWLWMVIVRLLMPNVMENVFLLCTIRDNLSL